MTWAMIFIASGTVNPSCCRATYISRMALANCRMSARAPRRGTAGSRRRLRVVALDDEAPGDPHVVTPDVVGPDAVGDQRVVVPVELVGRGDQGAELAEVQPGGVLDD